MDSLVQSTNATCVTCQHNDKTARTTHAPLIPVEYPAGPGQKLGIDVVGPFEICPVSSRYAFTLIDYHSKWLKTAFIPHVTVYSYQFSEINVQPKGESTGDCHQQWTSVPIIRVQIFPAGKRCQAHSDLHIPSRRKWSG